MKMLKDGGEALAVPYHSFAKKILDFLVYTNIFLAISVTALVWETELLLHTSTNDFRYPYFLFSATLFLYCFHRIYQGNSGSTTKTVSERHAWIQNNRLLFYAVFFTLFFLNVCISFNSNSLSLLL